MSVVPSSVAANFSKPEGLISPSADEPPWHLNTAVLHSLPQAAQNQFESENFYKTKFYFALPASLRYNADFTILYLQSSPSCFLRFDLTPPSRLGSPALSSFCDCQPEDASFCRRSTTLLYIFVISPKGFMSHAWQRHSALWMSCPTLHDNCFTAKKQSETFAAFCEFKTSTSWSFLQHFWSTLT